MSAIVEAVLIAAARELVLTRPAMTFWGERVFLAAAHVAFRESK